MFRRAFPSHASNAEQIRSELTSPLGVSHSRRTPSTGSSTAANSSPRSPLPVKFARQQMAWVEDADGHRVPLDDANGSTASGFQTATHQFQPQPLDEEKAMGVDGGRNGVELRVSLPGESNRTPDDEVPPHPYAWPGSNV